MPKGGRVGPDQVCRQPEGLVELSAWVTPPVSMGIFSTPVLMHGGLICITLCPSVRPSDGVLHWQVGSHQRQVAVFLNGPSGMSAFKRQCTRKPGRA